MAELTADGYDQNLIQIPRFSTYKPLEKDEKGADDEEYSKEKIEGLLQQECAFQKEQKKISKAAKKFKAIS